MSGHATVHGAWCRCCRRRRGGKEHHGGVEFMLHAEVARAVWALVAGVAVAEGAQWCGLSGVHGRADATRSQ
ncbi:hypothetical protein FXW78_20895 [Rhodococcus opacus]|nr:hypothetical protein [Rhodococcus opacus]